MHTHNQAVDHPADPAVVVLGELLERIAVAFKGDLPDGIRHRYEDLPALAASAVGSENVLAILLKDWASKEHGDMAHTLRELAERVATQHATIFELRGKLKHWQGNHANMVWRLRLCNDRPDLPIERTQAGAKLNNLQERVATLTQLLDAHRRALDSLYGTVMELRRKDELPLLMEAGQLPMLVDQSMMRRLQAQIGGRARAEALEDAATLCACLPSMPEGGPGYAALIRRLAGPCRQEPSVEDALC